MQTDPILAISYVPDDPLLLTQLVGSEGMLLIGLALLLAFAAMIFGILNARRQVRSAVRIANERSAELTELLARLAIAEEMAGIGLWQFDPATGAQIWSSGLRRIFGVEHVEPFVEGDAETLLFANNIDLIARVKERLAEREAYDLQFDIYGYDGKLRAICIQATNVRDETGDVSRIVAVVRDVTAQTAREKKLEFSRMAAVVEANHARELAETDPLTGLANRRRVMEQLDRLVKDARGLEQPLALITFDIDHFKQVNDTHGHLEGDKVLTEVARIVGEESRKDDLVGRVGGEEFVWIVPGAGEGMARILAERLRLAVERGSGTNTVSPVTISVGFAELCRGDTSLSLFARADSALYEAKHAGRNRIRMAA